MSEVIRLPWRILRVQKERRRGCFQLDPTSQPGRRCVGRPYPWSWPLTGVPHPPPCPPPVVCWTESPQCCSNAHQRSVTVRSSAEYNINKTDMQQSTHVLYFSTNLRYLSELILFVLLLLLYILEENILFSPSLSDSFSYFKNQDFSIRNVKMYKCSWNWPKINCVI